MAYVAEAGKILKNKPERYGLNTTMNGAPAEAAHEKRTKTRCA